MTRTFHPGEMPEERKARRQAESRAWAKANPDKTRQYGRNLYQKNAAQRRAASRAYYHSHKAERAAYAHAYYRRKRENDPDYFKRQNARRREQERLLREKRAQAASSCPLPLPLSKRAVRPYAAVVQAVD